MLELLSSIATYLKENYNKSQLLVYPNSTKCSKFWGGAPTDWKLKDLAKFQAASIFSTDKFVGKVFPRGIFEVGMLQQVLNYMGDNKKCKNAKALDAFRSKEKSNDTLYAELQVKSVPQTVLTNLHSAPS